MDYKKVLEKKIEEYLKESLKPMTSLSQFKDKIDESTINSLLSAYNKTLEMKSLVDLYRLYDKKDTMAKKLQSSLEHLSKEGEKAIKQGLLNCIDK